MNRASLILISFFVVCTFAGSTTKIFQGKQTGKVRPDGTCPMDSEFVNPVSVGKGLAFCTEYNDTSCCDSFQAQKIEKTVNQLMDSNCGRCYAMVKEWKCSECHPQAGFFYQGQFSSIRFCVDYCKEVFEACKDIPFDLAEKPFYLNDPADLDWEEWCYDITAKDGSCFSGRTFPELSNGDCACPDHQCHVLRRKALLEQKDEKQRKKREEKERRRKEREEAASQLLRDQKKSDEF